MPDFELAEGVASLDRDEWNALVGGGSPFLEWEWLASLEHAGCVGPRTGWDARPLVVREQGRLVAAAPLYIKSHSEGEFVFDWGWADAAERAGIAYYPKMLVAVPFSPVTGQRLLVAEGLDSRALRVALAEALRATCEGNELSGVHVNFCPEDEAALLETAGYMLRVGLQYHWRNHGYGSFDDYLAHFRSKRRNQIRRERRELERQGIEIRHHVGTDIPDELFEPMYRFYLATVRSHHHWGRQYLNREFFALMQERFRHRLVFIVAWRGGEPIAGTFNVAKGEALYGRYWGALEEHRNLHFNVCYYAAVEHCIDHGLARFEPGAGGEYKQMRGFDAHPTWSLHHLADPRLAAAVKQFLAHERERAHDTIDWYRAQSQLKHAPTKSGRSADD